MTQMHQHTAHSVCGNLSAERCIVELQRGRPIVLAGSSGDRSVSLVETLNSDTLAQIMAHGPCQLIISKARANVIGIATTERACCVSLGDEASLDMLRNCVGLTLSMHSAKNDSSFSERHKPLNVLPVHTLQEYADAGLQLALEAHVLPALIMSDCSISATSDALRVSVTDARSYSCNHRELLQLSHARLPLANAERVELCVFREKHGHAEHVAITVGQPDYNSSITVRLHSSCFTGDILNSMRCDCGEQLHSAITQMAQSNGGVILYLSQEGRGIGLSSKLLSYQLQDQGLDTIEANHSLGFDADQRRYEAATSMLNALGINTINLITNNPKKIEALRAQGINVVQRLPSHTASNQYNERYLETKRVRSGHLLPARPVR